MVRAKRRDSWMHTSSLLAMLANTNRDPKRTPKAYTAADFNPVLTEEEKRDSQPTVGIEALKGLIHGRGN